MPSKKQIEERMRALAERLGYEAHDIAYLSRAMYCKPQKGWDNYQNDEMATLGDAVLDLIFAEYFFLAGHDKGEITRRRSALVSNAVLRTIRDTLGVQQFAFNDDYFADEAPPHAQLPNKDHDFYMEAIFAAVYLDRGLDYTRGWLLSLFEKYAPTGWK